MSARSKNGRGGARAGSGPKPKPMKELRRNRMMLNFTDAEFAALRRVSGEQRPSEFVREIVLRYLARRRK